MEDSQPQNDFARLEARLTHNASQGNPRVQITRICWRDAMFIDLVTSAILELHESTQIAQLDGTQCPPQQ
ncbi:MAG: hypothetical protein B7Z55_09840 [Planctomycetales bacterium 12-60-4]|nr:MAG: hypothetical protein B7Z55_09840 [Planctomycetales bacterium 12-60-4]